MKNFYLITGNDKRRLNFMLEQLPIYGVGKDEITLILTPNFDDVEKSAELRSLQQGLSSRQASVTLKHFLALREISTSDVSYGIIMEDNILILGDVRKRIDRYLSEVNNDWDLIFDSDIVSSENVKDAYQENKFLYKKSNEADEKLNGASKGANFIVVRKEAALKLVNAFFPLTNVSDYHYNNLIRKLDLNVYWAEPPNIHKLSCWGSTVTVADHHDGSGSVQTDAQSSPTNIAYSESASNRINRLMNLCSGKKYLEIGVMAGVTFRQVNAMQKTGVDPKFLFDTALLSSDNVIFAEMVSDEFFAKNSSKQYDFVFIDGLHTFSQTLRDLLSAISCLQDKYSLILIDDVYPKDIFSAIPNQAVCYAQRKKFIGSEQVSLEWRGDVFKILLFINNYLPTFDYLTLDEGSGDNFQILLYKTSKPRVINTPILSLENIERLSFADIDNFREVFRFTKLDVAYEKLSSRVF